MWLGLSSEANSVLAIVPVPAGAAETQLLCQNLRSDSSAHPPPITNSALASTCIRKRTGLGGLRDRTTCRKPKPSAIAPAHCLHFSDFVLETVTPKSFVDD
jgi:hypothetical protein